MATTLINNFPLRISPVNNIAPFTYRDGETYLEILYRLKDYINDSLRPEFNDELARIIDEFNAGIANSETVITGALAEWESRFTAFMADIAANIAGLNDTAIAGLIGNSTSATYAALNTLLDAEIAAAFTARFDNLFIDVSKPPYNVDFTGNTSSITVAANTAGLQAAFNHGGRILAPSGTAVINGEIAAESYTHLEGVGIDRTILKLANGLPWDTRIIHHTGKTHASISGMTVDGNQANKNHLGGTGGIYGTNLSAVNSTYIHYSHVKSINAIQHCFDATTPYYGNAGDGQIIPNPSEHISYEYCIADKHGDDGFTTHGSGYITYRNCKAFGPWNVNDTAYVNANGWEIDDYSYNVTITDCYSTGNAHGYEFKAHGNMSAARNIRIVGSVAEFNETNISVRHIGHHVNYPGAPAVLSKTAKNIQIIGCTARFPSRVFFGGVDQTDGDVPDDQTPPGDQYCNLMIGAYRGVTITNFHAISDPTFNYAGSSSIVFHYLAEDILLDGYHISGHTTGMYDIYVPGGDQPARNVTIVNGTHRDSAPSAISCGSVSAAIIQNVSISRNVAGSPNLYGVRAFGNKLVRNVRFDSAAPAFQYPYQISYTYYSAYETPLVANTTITGPPA